MSKKVVIDKNKRLDGDNRGVIANLGRLPQPVKELFYAGNFLDLLAKPAVAIVGSRKVSPYGREVTVKLASELARAGVVIISGLALGVDSIAHQAALEAGGQTIAVLPSSIDSIYPRYHTNLARQIIEQGGALVSEYPDGSPNPQKYQFIARNRIIAALSQGVLISEAAAISGSLHTANFALEQGIDVFAVPGNITNINSEGTNNLIKTGAGAVTNTKDILEALGIEVKSAKNLDNFTEAEQTIISLIKQGINDANELLQRSQFQPDIFNQIVTMLEIKGALGNQAGRYSLI